MYYNQTDGFHLKKFPAEIIRLSGLCVTGHATEANLKKAVQDALDVYHGVIQKEKKVIVYSIALPTNFKMIKDENYDGRYSGVNPIVPGKLQQKIRNLTISTDDGFGFFMNHKIYFQVEDNGVVYYPINRDGTKGYKANISSEYLIMDWTPEREQFFKDLQEATKSMVAQMLNFFGKDDEQLLPIIDSGKASQKLLG